MEQQGQDEVAKRIASLECATTTRLDRLESVLTVCM